MRANILIDDPLPVITETQYYWRAQVMIEINESRILKRRFHTFKDAIDYSFKFCLTWNRLHNWQVPDPVKPRTQLMIDDGSHDHGSDELQLGARSKKLARFS